jgi:hypothetical protein
VAASFHPAAAPVNQAVVLAEEERKASRSLPAARIPAPFAEQKNVSTLFGSSIATQTLEDSFTLQYSILANP